MKEKIYSKDIAHAINTYLKEDDWHFSFDEKRGVFKFGLSLKGKMKKINYIIYIKEDEYVVYAVSPLGADEEDEKMMATMAEFVCRANYGLKNGNFELDMRDGEIRFKCFADCEGIIPTTEMIRNSIHCPAAMFEQYAEGIVGIIFGNLNAKDAVEKCEKSPMDELRTILGDELDGDADLDTMIARLAEKLGIDVGGSVTDTDSLTSSDTVAEIKTDLFSAKGGNN